MMESPRVKEAEHRLTVEPWDVDAWMILFSEAQQAPFADAKPVYERLVEQFPPSGKIWRTYAEHMTRDTLQEADNDVAPIIALYDRGVRDAPTSVELWHSYISFMSNQATKALATGTLALEADALAVHERAISAAGMDVKADVLWNQYFTFLTSFTSLTDTQRREALRRLHQRAVMHCTISFTFLPFPRSVGVILRSACVLFLSESIEKKKLFGPHPSTPMPIVFLSAVTFFVLVCM